MGIKKPKVTEPEEVKEKEVPRKIVEEKKELTELDRVLLLKPWDGPEDPNEPYKEFMDERSPWEVK